MSGQVTLPHKPLDVVLDRVAAYPSRSGDLADCHPPVRIDAGDDILAPMMKRVLLRAIAIGKRRDRLKDSTASPIPCRPGAAYGRYHEVAADQPSRHSPAQALRQDPLQPLRLPSHPRHTRRKLHLSVTPTGVSNYRLCDDTYWWTLTPSWYIPSSYLPNWRDPYMQFKLERAP